MTFTHEKALGELLKRACAKVPRYKDEKCDTLGDVPLVTKGEMMRNVEDFVSDDYASMRQVFGNLVRDRGEIGSMSNFQIAIGEDIVVEQTTGTTGVPGRFPKTRKERGALALGIWRARKSFDPDASAGRFMQFVHHPIGAPKDHRIHSGACEDLRQLYADAAGRGITWLHAQPTLLMRHMEILRRGGVLEVPDIFTVIETTGEHVCAEDRAALERFFKCRVFNQYGSIETWAIGYERRGEEAFEPLQDNVHVEVVNPATGAACRRGEVGSVAITCLKLFMMPIVRYLTGDRAEWVEMAGERRLRLHEDRSCNFLQIAGKDVAGSSFARLLLNDALARVGYIYYDYIQFRQVGDCEILVVIDEGSKRAEFFREIVASASRRASWGTQIRFRLETIRQLEADALAIGKRSLFTNLMAREGGGRPRPQTV